MQEITPKMLASLIYERLIRIDFAKSEFDHDDPVVGLTLYLKDEMPENVFSHIRFDLIIQVAEPGAIKPKSKADEPDEPVDPYQAISFAVTDVLATMGSQPHYILQLRPVAKKRLLDPCHATAFKTLADETHMQKRDWREEVLRVRFFHARHADAGYECENPRANPLRANAPLPAREAPGDDDGDLQNLLAAADDAFSDPCPGEESAPVSDRTHDFDLDEALRTSAA